MRKGTGGGCSQNGRKDCYKIIQVKGPELGPPTLIGRGWGEGIVHPFEVEESNYASGHSDFTTFPQGVSNGDNTSQVGISGRWHLGPQHGYTSLGVFHSHSADAPHASASKPHTT